MITHEEFITDVYNAIDRRPFNWRQGQACFNFIESKYHVGRSVQFEDNVDCFYDDKQIDDFVDKAWKRLEIANN